MKNERIVLKGQKYATPRTESVAVSNQGVLCASGAPVGVKGFGLRVTSGGLN